ncbi:hypothetical protein PVT67_09975 [Gallaecimonas kandeliae]|uniref:hypothetical protein n=1 Tax=Gallaecimonas kandeliae TaxID=3029055 RepID=UPI0026494A59|nr:hypothetical protein [Gallaecimonas kandeliae]WKE64027.1 hypothetical protein PVT67_09975 [Gallaecimonas kandeliae]
MIKVAIITFLCLLLSSCSVIGTIELFNNTDTILEACNINKTSPTCYKIAARASVNIPLSQDSSSPIWQLSVSVNGAEPNIYSFSFTYEKYKVLASHAYCGSFMSEACSIPLQYEASKLIYWVGRDEKMPIQHFPEQLEGFPVAPST